MTKYPCPDCGGEREKRLNAIDIGMPGYWEYYCSKCKTIRGK